jgi:hypothetical protein
MPRSFLQGDITDWQRIQDLAAPYADPRPGGTDASMIALAEHRGALRIATHNRRHFAVIRSRHTDAFQLMPWREPGTR